MSDGMYAHSDAAHFVQALNRPVVVRNVMSKALGWGSALDWSAAALKAAVGHAEIRVRTLPQAGVVSQHRQPGYSQSS